MSQNEIDAAILVQTSELNTQEQRRAVWPANSVVSRAYVDQLTRTKGIQPERARAVTSALGRADKVRSARDKGAAAVVKELDTLAGQLERDAAAAASRDGIRLKSLAATLKDRTAKLR